MTEKTPMHTTNFLTILAGLYGMAMSYISSFATIFVTWTSLVAALSALGVVIGSAKTLYDWRKAMRRAAIEEAEHQLKLKQAEREEAEHQARMLWMGGRGGT
jgi:FtsH-binding integral membrane protein